MPLLAPDGRSPELQTVRDHRRGELVERRVARPRALRDEQILLRELRLDRRDVRRLQQLRDEQLADARVLVPRLARVAVREQPVSGEVRSGRRRSRATRRSTPAGRIRARCARGRARRCAWRCPRRAGATSRRSAGRRSCARLHADPAKPRRADCCAASAATNTTKASDRRDRTPWRDRVGWSSDRRDARRRRPWPCSCASTGWRDRARRRARAGAALQ